MLAVAPMLVGAACEEPLIPSSGFDIWCGQTLCQWKVDRGAISKVPTWNDHDYGVQLGGDTRISRHLDFNNDKVKCIDFNLVANIDNGTNVVLGIDFNDDGSTEYNQTLPSGAWAPLRYRITAPTYFNGARIFIDHTGNGGAALAQLQELDSSDCSGAPVSTTGRPLGAHCESDDQCTSSRCRPRTTDEQLTPTTNDTASLCEGCDADSDCGAGQICGLVFGAEFRAPFLDCIPAAHGYGERCARASECATGVCCGGMCSTCCKDGGPGCSDGRYCFQDKPDGRCGCQPLRMPWRCNVGSFSGGPGAACANYDDCASPLKCTGVVEVGTCATDGRRCSSAADCPDALPSSPYTSNSAMRCSGYALTGGQCQ
jgi:hypothetical protein